MVRLRNWFVGLLLGFLAFGGILESSGWAQDQILVKRIEILGTQKVEVATVRAKLKTQVGKPFSLSRVREDIKELYRIGYFDDIRVETEPFEGGIKVTFVFVERPVIREVIFLGNKKLSDGKLREHITILPYSILNQALIAENRRALRNAYEADGYYLAEVLPVVKVLSPYEVNVLFVIREGPKVKIQKIEIRGNRHFSERRAKKAMRLKEHGIFSWVTGSGRFRESEMNRSIEQIKSLYYDDGFLQIKVDKPRITLSADRTRMTILITVSEGKRFRVGKLDLSGYEILDEATLRGALLHKPGEVFSRGRLRKEILRVSELYNERGRAFANISPEVTPDPETETVDILYNITEGAEVNVGRIQIVGNTKTRDKVIRREIRLDEGDTFNSKLLRRSYERLYNLNYFESVEILPSRRKDREDVMDLAVRVREQSTGTFTIGAGYSSFDKFIATGSVTQGNLFGRGQTLKLSSELGARTQLYNLLFREPWLADRPIGGTFNLYRNETAFDSYNEIAAGVSLGLDKVYSEYVRGSFTYKYERINIFDVSDTAISIIKEQEGKTTTSSMRFGVIRDSRDNYLLPRSGARHSLSVEYAGGLLGGTNDFYKVIADAAWHFPLFWDTRFGFHTRFGYGAGLGGQKFPVFERFFVGGISTVRGFYYGDAGPKDETGDRVGGDKELIFNLEYVFPLIPEARLMGVVFYDMGAAFAGEERISYDGLRHSTGAGVRWISPVGPLRVEWGYNLRPKPGEKKSRVEFTIGSFF